MVNKYNKKHVKMYKKYKDLVGKAAWCSVLDCIALHMQKQKQYSMYNLV